MTRLQTAITHVLNLSLKHPKKIIGLWLFVVIVMTSSFKPFKMLITIDGLINNNFQSAKNFRTLKENFEEGTPLLLLHHPRYDQRELCDLRKWLTTLPSKEPHLLRTLSLFSLRKPRLLPAQEDMFPRLTFPTLLRVQCAQNQITGWQDLRQTPWSGVLWPDTGLSSKPLSSFLTEMRFKDLGEVNFQSKVIPKIVQKIKEEYPEALKEKTFWLGEAAYQMHMKEGLRHNNLLNGMLLILVVLLMKLFLGTWHSGLFFISTLITCAFFLFGFMSITGTPLDVLNNSLFILLSVASLGDFIFICHHQRKFQTSWQESFKALIFPSFFTSLTTFLGFLSLVTSDLDIIKRLGLWAALSGVIEWLVLFSLLPAVMSVFSKKRPFSVHTRASSFLNNLERISLNKATKIIFVLVYFAAPFAPFTFNINDNPTLLFPKSHEFREAIATLKRTLNFSGEISLVVKRQGGSEDDLKRELHLLDQKANLLEEERNIIKVERPSRLLSFFEQDFPLHERQLIRSNLKKSPGYRQLISDTHIRAKLYLKETSLRDINHLRVLTAQNICPNKECGLSGALVAYAEFSQRVPRTLLFSLATSLILVFIILFLIHLSLKRPDHKLSLFPVLLSGFWGVAFVLLLLAITQFKLNFVTCVVLAILVGMTGDNAIHYLLGHQSGIEKGIADKQGASLLTTVIMSLCCSIFFFFSFQPPRILGVLLIFGLWGSLAGDLWFLKALLKKKGDH